MDAVIVTADRDFFQLVRPGIQVMFNRRGISDIVLYDEAGVEERFGVPPSKYLEYVALKGDPSDNIPGVPGVGEKTATKLIQQYGSVEDVARARRRAAREAEGQRPGVRGAADPEQGAGADRHRPPAGHRPRGLRHGGVGSRRGAPAVHVPRVPFAARPAERGRRDEAQGRGDGAGSPRGLGRRARGDDRVGRAEGGPARRRPRARCAARPPPRGSAGRVRAVGRAGTGGRRAGVAPTRRSGRTTRRSWNARRSPPASRSRGWCSTRSSPATCSIPPPPSTRCAR